MGIEPTSKAWEALVLPLNYTREDKYFSMEFDKTGSPHSNFFADFPDYFLKNWINVSSPAFYP